MNKNKKYLVWDASAWEPYKFAIKNAYLSNDNIQEFQKIMKLEFYLTKEMKEEGSFSHSVQPDFFTSSPSATSSTMSQVYYLNDSGTITEEKCFNGAEFVINPIIDSRMPQQRLWQSSNTWTKLSKADKSCQEISEILIDNGESAIVIANEKNLRKQLSLSGLPFKGSFAILADMVILNIISSQKGTKLYYKWKDYDPQWVPSRDLTFKQILDWEKNEIWGDKSYWQID